MDKVGDFLTRIRNSVSAGHEKVDIPSSKLRQGIARILEDKGYIRSHKVAKDGRQGMMRVYLKYSARGRPMLSHLERVSRPSRRRYVSAKDISPVRSGLGVAVISTSRGLLDGEEAKKQNLGGEFICRVW